MPAKTHNESGALLWRRLFSILGLAAVAAMALCIWPANARGQIYVTNDRRIRLEATCKWPHSEPIAILDTGAANEFAVCFVDGRVLTYRLPRQA